MSGTPGRSLFPLKRLEAWACIRGRADRLCPRGQIIVAAGNFQHYALALRSRVRPAMRRASAFDRWSDRPRARRGER